jgi:hypothetical protein
MSAPVSASSVARTRLSVCSTEVALAIGAVTPGLAMAQAFGRLGLVARCELRDTSRRTEK